MDHRPHSLHGFFVVNHSAGGLETSASVTSSLAVKRPVHADKRNPFIKSSADFVIQFDFARFLTPDELEEASKLIDEAWKVLSPTQIWTSLHRQIVDIINSRVHNRLKCEQSRKATTQARTKKGNGRRRKRNVAS